MTGSSYAIRPISSERILRVYLPSVLIDQTVAVAHYFTQLFVLHLEYD